MMGWLHDSFGSQQCRHRRRVLNQDLHDAAPIVGGGKSVDVVSPFG